MLVEGLGCQLAHLPIRVILTSVDTFLSFRKVIAKLFEVAGNLRSLHSHNGLSARQFDWALNRAESIVSDPKDLTNGTKTCQAV